MSAAFHPNNIICKLISIINACFTHNYFPISWKQAKIFLLPKPGKDSSKPDGYRPISLLSSLGKIYERLILTRLEPYLPLLPDEQYSFRKNLSTTRQLVRIVEFIGAAFHNKQSVALLMLDVAKAFDRVWHEGLIFKLINMGLQRELILLIYSFLQHRTFYVIQGNEKSNIKPIRSSVPQGSILGPILYLFYISDFPKPNLNHYSLLACYADDTAIAIKSIQAKQAIAKMQQYLHSVEDWCTNWRVKINATKSQLLILNKSKKFNNLQDLLLFQEPVPIVSKAKYLGIILNSKLTWSDHIQSVKNKALGIMIRFLPVIGKYSNLSLRTKRHIYTSCIRPILCYASPAWNTATYYTHITKLAGYNPVVEHPFKSHLTPSITILLIRQ
ncbi:RNA-directed DNA polymerase from mobile element jockey, partial [Stegodyphus mimosarum]